MDDLQTIAEALVEAHRTDDEARVEEAIREIERELDAIAKRREIPWPDVDIDTKCTEWRCDVICEAVRKGHDEKFAAELAQTADVTVRRWRRFGLEGREPYATFLARYNVAKKEIIDHALRTIRNAKTKHGTDDWKALAWWLERRFPKDFGQRQSIELVGRKSNEELLEQIEPLVSESAWAEIIAAIAQLKDVDIDAEILDLKAFPKG